jgi:hypothetical protein
MDLGCVQPCMITKVLKTGVLNLQGCKTMDRTKDLENFKLLSNAILQNINLSTFVKEFIKTNPSWVLNTENPEYGNAFSEQTFKFIKVEDYIKID